MSPDNSAGVSPVMQESKPSRVAGILTLALAVVAGVRVGQFFASLPIAARFQFDYEEGNILNALSRILHGATPYPDPRAFPSVINPYGPAAYYLLAIPARIFGLAFVYPRATILGFAVLIAVFIGIELRRATRSTALGFTFALIFLTVPNVQQWAWLLRVDLLGIAFTAAGLEAFCREIHDGVTSDVAVSVASRDRIEEPASSVLVPALLFALGLLVKPTLLAAPAACFFALIARRNFRGAFALTAMTAAAFGLVLAIFAAVTRGAVLTDVFLSHPDPFSLRPYTRGLIQMLETSWPLVVLAVIAVARDLAARRRSPAVLWVIFATLTSITAGKLGSNQNHFLEWNAALCLAAGIGMGGLFSVSNRQLSMSIAALAIAVTALVISRQPDCLGNVNPQRGCPAAYEWVRTQAGANLLSENVGALVLGRKEVWVSNPFVLAQQVEHAGGSDAALVHMARDRRFDAILTRVNYASTPAFLSYGSERFSGELLRDITDNYAPEVGFDCLDMNVVYKPKSPPAIQSK